MHSQTSHFRSLVRFMRTFYEGLNLFCDHIIVCNNIATQNSVCWLVASQQSWRVFGCDLSEMYLIQSRSSFQVEFLFLSYHLFLIKNLWVLKSG